MLRTIQIVVLISLISTSAGALGKPALDGLVECPPGNEALPRVTETPYGASITETFAMEIGGRSLAVPLGYLSPRPPRKIYKNQPFRSPKGFKFSFWMPDGRMPEVDTYFNVMNRPCEAGRAQANDEKFVVDVTYKPLGPETDFDKVDFNDEFVLSNLRTIRDFDTRAEFIRRGDMIELRLRNFKVHWIVSAPEAEFDAVVSCGSAREAPNELCTGDVWFHGDDYALFLVMPRDSTEWFADAARLARQLIDTWRGETE